MMDSIGIAPSQPNALARTAIAYAAKLGGTLGITLVCSFIMRAMMPRLMDTSSMGGFYVAESFPQMFFTMLPLGIFAYIQKTFPGDPGRVRELFFTIIAFELVLGLLIAAVMFTTLKLNAAAAGGLELTMLMGVYAAAQTFFTNILKPTFIAIGRINLATTVEAVAAVMQTTLVVAGLFLTHKMLTAGAAFAGVEVAACAVLVAAAGRSGVLVPRLELGKLRTMVTTSLPFFALSILLPIASNLDQTVLSHLASPAEVGYYGAASRLKGICLMLVPILSLGLFPVLSRSYKESAVAYLALARRLLRVLLAFATLLAFAMVLTPDWIVGVLYGPTFTPSIRLAAGLAPVLILTYWNVFFGTHLILTTSGHRMVGVIAVTALANYGLNKLMIPYGLLHWGLGGGGLGAVVAATGSELVCTIGFLLCCPLRFVDRRFALRVLAALAPCALMLTYLPQLLATPVLLRMAALAVFGPLYLMATGFTSVKEVRGLLQMRHDLPDAEPPPSTLSQ